MFSELVILFFGLIFLYWGAGFVVDGATKLAKNSGFQNYLLE